MELVAAGGEPASTASPPTSTPGIFLTTCCRIMRLTQLNGTRRWPCCRHYARRPSGAFRIGPSKVQNARIAHEGPSCGGARGIAVGSTEWGRRVCGSVFYGEHGGKCVRQWSRRISCFVCWIATGGGPISW